LEKEEWLKKSMVEIIQYNSQNTNPNKRAIYIHGGMEHNLARYAKYYSFRSTKYSRGSEFTIKNDYNRRDFLGH